MAKNDTGITEGKVIDTMTMDGMLQSLGLEATVVTESAGDIQRRIVENILSRDSVDDILSGASGGLTSCRELSGETVRIKSVTWNVSDFAQQEDNVLPFYAVCEAVVLGTDEDVTFSCGAVTAMAQLFKLDHMSDDGGKSVWPLDMVVVEGRQTKAGNVPYWFEAPANKEKEKNNK